MGITSALVVAAVVGAVGLFRAPAPGVAPDEGPTQSRSGGYATGSDGHKRSISYTDYGDRSFREIVADAESDLDIVVDYRDCLPLLAEAVVRQGSTSGADVREYLENLQIRLTGSSPRYRVERETSRLFALTCD
jgi:hypothetical protein